MYFAIAAFRVVKTLSSKAGRRNSVAILATAQCSGTITGEFGEPTGSQERSDLSYDKLRGSFLASYDILRKKARSRGPHPSRHPDCTRRYHGSSRVAHVG